MPPGRRGEVPAYTPPGGSAATSAAREAFLRRYATRLEPVAGLEGVYLRVLTLGELRTRVFPLLRDDADLTATLLELAVCDGAGDPLVAAAELDGLAGGPLADLAKRACDLNGLSARAEDEAKKA